MKEKPKTVTSVAGGRPTQPKVFISYSWTSKDKARNLAERLLSDGIDVVMDIYDLKEGMDKYAFMQRTVCDASIEKVLMLCDRAYKEKADDFKGGVGDEAMIISPELYGKVEQQKFIPIVLEKDDGGVPYLPVILKSRIYIDFCDEHEVEGYEKLVRNLWGKPDLRKPPLGQRPSWIDDSSITTYNIKNQINALRTYINARPDPNAALRRTAFGFLSEINKFSAAHAREPDLLKMIKETEPLRNCFVDLIDLFMLKDKPVGCDIASLIETMYNGVKIDSNNNLLEECWHFFFWDIFICTAALMLSYERYADLHQLLNRTYFLRNIIGTANDPRPRTYSDLRQPCRILESTFKQNVNPRLISLAAELLIKREYGECITERNLVTADLTLAHLSMLFCAFAWYPVLGPYCSWAGNQLIWEKMVSKSFCEKLYPLLDVKSFAEFTEKVKAASDKWNSGLATCYEFARFGGVPPILRKGDYERIGSMP